MATSLWLIKHLYFFYSSGMNLKNQRKHIKYHELGNFPKLCHDDIKFILNEIPLVYHKRFMRLKRYLRNAGFDFQDKTLGQVINYCF